MLCSEDTRQNVANECKKKEMYCLLMDKVLAQIWESMTTHVYIFCGRRSDQFFSVSDGKKRPCPLDI